MSLEAIKKISEVEKQAEDIIAAAKVEARERTSKAQKDGENLREDLVSAENRRIQETAAKVQQESEAKAKNNVEKAYAQSEDISKKALENMPAAISLIVGRVVKE